MGRAYEVRKVSIMKTGAAKGKLYSMYAREIYQAAKNGGVETESNYKLKRVIEKAKSEQVPNDIIKRAIDKVNSGVGEDYVEARYELFGPNGSTMVVDCLTDNVKRSVSAVRTVVNKCHIKLAAIGCVTFMYDHLCVVAFKGLDEEATLEALIEAGIDVEDIEMKEDITVVYGNPNDLFDIKNAIIAKLGEIEFETDEIVMIPKDTIKLEGEDMEVFAKSLQMLDEIEDVQKVYHNVENA